MGKTKAQKAAEAKLKADQAAAAEKVRNGIDQLNEQMLAGADPSTVPPLAPLVLEGDPKNSSAEPSSFRIPTPASRPPFAVSPAFGFIFARKGNGCQALYRIVTDPDGTVTEMKELFAGPTRVVIKVMVNCLRKINLDGTFRTGKLEEQKPVVPEKKGATA